MGNDWAKEFRDKLDNWRQPAPEGLWEAVSSEMGVAHRRSPVRRFFGWAGGIAAAAAVVAAVLFFGFGHGQVDGSDVSLVRESSGDVLAQVIAEGNGTEDVFGGESAGEVLEEMPGKELGEVLSGEASDGESKDFLTGGKENFRTGGKKVAEAVSEGGVSGDTSEDILKGGTDDGGLNGMPEEDEPAGEDGDETAGDVWKEPAGDVWKEIVDESVRAGRPGRGNVRVGAAVSGGNGGNSHLDGYAGAVAATGMVNAFGENPQADIMLFNRTREVSTDTKYFQPVKAGVSVKWNFAGRWGLESGLYWSGLYSRTTSGSENYFTRSRQELHYLGIPLNLTCDIWSGKGFTVYATAGGMMEKCVGGRVRTEYVCNNTTTAPESSAISEKQLQWSAGVNVGAEYLFTRHIGLYLEPGAVWHFNNGSAIDNVYKARPFDFNLSLGLRFAF